MKEKILWNLYRDESNRPIMTVVDELVRAYMKKMRIAPSIIGVPPSCPNEWIAMLVRRFDEVQVVVPAWAINEIWLGMKIDEEEQR